MVNEKFESSEYDIMKLKDRCHSLDMKMAKIMLELLKELEHHENLEDHESSITEDIKEEESA